MSTTNNERRTYCPLVQLKTERGETEEVLDTLLASYEGLREQNIRYDTFTVTESEAGQPDAIAWKFYGSSELWWVICTFNEIIDPYTEVVSGVKLRVPRLDEVLLYLTRVLTQPSTLSVVHRVGAIGEI